MTTTVPDGHLLTFAKPVSLPGVRAATGGAWIADLGTSSDAADEELARVIAELDAKLAGGAPNVMVAQVSQVSELFAPANPKVSTARGLVVWVVDADAMAPALVDRWLEQLTAYRARIPQFVSLRDARSPRARTVAALVGKLAIDVRACDPTGAVLVEVKRPEGIVLTVVPGAPVATAGAPASLSPGEAPPVVRAPRLRALLAASDSRLLHDELLRRELPLLVLVDHKGATGQTTWPDGSTGIACYPDQASLLASARSLGREPASIGMATMSPRKLFEWAAQQGVCVGIQYYRDDGAPQTCLIAAATVRALATRSTPGQR